MDKAVYQVLEAHMLACMQDSAHDKDHVYRVLYAALDLAHHETAPVDMDVLVAACLLHDIGRDAQFKDSSLCHAQVGSVMAYDFLCAQGWPQEQCAHVQDCILTHRYRTNRRPATLEAKLLFDADKLDVTGPIGIARTLFYCGQTSGPLYSLGTDGSPLDGASPGEPSSFCHEYRYKLQTLHLQFYTTRAAELAQKHHEAAEAYYQSLCTEVRDCYSRGLDCLQQLFTISTL